MFKAKAILNLIAIFSVAVTAITLGSVAAEGPTDTPTNQPDTPTNQPEKKVEVIEKSPVRGQVRQNESSEAGTTVPNKKPQKDKLDKAETLQRILEKLETISRDPFAPSDVITREQLKKNDRFVPVENSAFIPLVELISYAEVNRDGKMDSLACLRIEDRLYFVRVEDQITIRSSGKNVVILIETIGNGHVEIKVGELSETVIVR